MGKDSSAGPTRREPDAASARPPVGANALTSAGGEVLFHTGFAGGVRYNDGAMVGASSIADENWEQYLKEPRDPSCKYACLVSSSHLCGEVEYDNLNRHLPRRPLYDPIRNWEKQNVLVDNFSHPGSSARSMFHRLSRLNLPKNVYSLIVLMLGSNLEENINEKLTLPEIEEFLKSQAKSTAEYIHKCYILLRPSLRNRGRGKFHVILPPGRATEHFNFYLQFLQSFLTSGEYAIPEKCYYGPLDGFHDRYLNIDTDLLHEKKSGLDVHMTYQAYAKFNSILDKLARDANLF